MTHIEIPAHLWPATAGEMYRLVTAIPAGLGHVRILSIEDGTVTWEVLP